MSTTGKATGWKLTRGRKNREEVSSQRFVGRSDDLIIALIGHTGAGKSLFIRDYTKDPSVIVGHGMEPCTRDVAGYHASVPSLYQRPLGQRRLILIDTPGMDDAYPDEPDILRQVSHWLNQAYDTNKAITGIVYIHDITSRRISRSATLGLATLAKLCGVIHCKTIVLATTKWDCLSDIDVGIRYEQKLRTELWGPALKRGARSMRLEQRPDDLHAMVNYLLDSGLGSNEYDWLGQALSLNLSTTTEHTKEKLGKDSQNLTGLTDEPRSDDTIIVLMGYTGAGKSTFINQCSPNKQAEVGHSLVQCTRDSSWYTAEINCPTGSRRLILVDTPGLGDGPHEAEANKDVLRRLVKCIEPYCSMGTTLAGVLYLHDINQKRAQGEADAHIEEFKQLVRVHLKCASFPVGLVTTQWDEVDEEIGVRREAQLKSSVWEGLIAQGALVYRAQGKGSQICIAKQFLGWS